MKTCNEICLYVERLLRATSSSVHQNEFNHANLANMTNEFRQLDFYILQ